VRGQAGRADRNAGGERSRSGTPLAAALEQRAQRDSLLGRAADVGLQSPEFEFDRADQPQSFCVQLVERGPFGVERADVAIFADLTALLFREPEQGQPLGSAYVGAIGVDAAFACASEKRTSARRMWGCVSQQRLVGSANPLRFDRQDREIIQAAGVAAPLAAQALAVVEGEFARSLVDPRVELV
jgi:hypothetical protein